MMPYFITFISALAFLSQRVFFFNVHRKYKLICSSFTYEKKVHTAFQISQSLQNKVIYSAEVRLLLEEKQ